MQLIGIYLQIHYSLGTNWKVCASDAVQHYALCDLKHEPKRNEQWICRTKRHISRPFNNNKNALCLRHERHSVLDNKLVFLHTNIKHSNILPFKYINFFYIMFYNSIWFQIIWRWLRSFKKDTKKNRELRQVEEKREKRLSSWTIPYKKDET